MMAPLAGERH